MATCPKCGVEVPEGVAFCHVCGAEMNVETNAEEVKEEVKEKAEEFKEEVKEKAEDFKEKAEEIKEKAAEKFDDVKEKAADVAADIKAKVEEAKAAAIADDDDVYTEEDIKANKVYAVLAYFGILVLVPLFAAKESKFARFHANQGLILFVLTIICSILTSVPVVKWFVWIVEVAIFVFAIMGIINAAKGECKELPIIGKYRFIK